MKNKEVILKVIVYLVIILVLLVYGFISKYWFFFVGALIIGIKLLYWLLNEKR